MPEQNKNVISKYQGEANFDKEYAKLAKKITDVAKHMIGGVRVEVDGKVIDGSIRNKLEQIKEVMNS